MPNTIPVPNFASLPQGGTLVKGKGIPLTAVEAHKVVKRRGSHIF
jgi:hypothetical protein